MSAPILDSIDRNIIRVLINEAIPMTIGEISKKTGISWITVKGHVKNLVLLGLVEEIITETRKTPKMMLNFERF